jgi:hypothetical protein
MVYVPPLLWVLEIKFAIFAWHINWMFFQTEMKFLTMVVCRMWTKQNGVDVHVINIFLWRWDIIYIQVSFQQP